MCSSCTHLTACAEECDDAKMCIVPVSAVKGRSEGIWIVLLENQMFPRFSPPSPLLSAVFLKGRKIDQSQ